MEPSPFYGNLVPFRRPRNPAGSLAGSIALFLCTA